VGGKGGEGVLAIGKKLITCQKDLNPKRGGKAVGYGEGNSATKRSKSRRTFARAGNSFLQRRVRRWESSCIRKRLGKCLF